MLKTIILLLSVLLPASLFGSADIGGLVKDWCRALVTKASNRVFLSNTVIGVVEFVNLSDDAKREKIAEGVTAMVADSLKNLGCRLVERQQLQKIIEEQKLVLSGVIDESTAAQLGKMSGASVMLVGSVSRLGANFNFSARLVDSETGEVIASSILSLPAEELIALVRSTTREEKYPATALFRSMIVPGWGQFYYDQPVKGSIILGSELLLAGSGTVLAVLGNLDYQTYSAGGAAQVPLYDTAMGKYWAADALFAAAILVYAYNLIDAYFFNNAPANKPAVTGLFNPAPDGMSLSLVRLEW